MYACAPSLSLPWPLPLPELGLVYIDQEHEKNSGENWEAREIIARAGAHARLYVPENENLRGFIAWMHDKDVFVLGRIEGVLPRNRNAKAQRKCLRHLKESPSSCKVPSSYLKVSKFQETHFQHKPLFLCVFSPNWSSMLLFSFDSPTESWFGAPVLHLPLQLLPLDPSKSALAPPPNHFLAHLPTLHPPSNHVNFKSSNKYLQIFQQ